MYLLYPRIHSPFASRITPSAVAFPEIARTASSILRMILSLVKGSPLLRVVPLSTLSLVNDNKCLAQHVEVLMISLELHDFCWKTYRFRFFHSLQIRMSKRQAQLVPPLWLFELSCRFREIQPCKVLEKKINLVGFRDYLCPNFLGHRAIAEDMDYILWGVATNRAGRINC